MGGESVDRRELLQQLAERDLHVERLLQQERRLGEDERVEAELEKRGSRVDARRVHARQIGEQASQAVDQGVSSSGCGCVGRVACDWHLILVTIVVDGGVGTARDRFSGGAIHPVALALERIRRKRNAAPPAVRMEGAPVEGGTGDPELPRGEKQR